MTDREPDRHLGERAIQSCGNRSRSATKTALRRARPSPIGSNRSRVKVADGRSESRDARRKGSRREETARLDADAPDDDRRPSEFEAFDRGQVGV